MPIQFSTNKDRIPSRPEVNFNLSHHLSSRRALLLGVEMQQHRDWFNGIVDISSETSLLLNWSIVIEYMRLL